MSQSYTLNYPNNPYYSGTTTQDYATRAFAPQNSNTQFNPYLYNGAPGQNQSIFTGNTGNTPLTLPTAQPMSAPNPTDLNADSNTPLTLPNAQAELPDGSADFAQNEFHKPTYTEELKSNLLFGGALASVPLMLTPIQSLKVAIPTDNLVDAKGILTQGGSADDLAKVYKEAHRISRYSKSISEAGRSAAETDKVMKLLKTLREGHKKALLDGNKALAEVYANDMKAVVSKAKKQGLFSKIFKGKKAAASFGQITEGLKTVNKNGKLVSNVKVPPQTMKTALKSAKMGAVLAAVVEVPEVYTAFSEGGAKEGLKQTGKSAVTATAETVGWWAGAKVGTPAGAAIGTKVGAAIGACFGGVGAAPGAAIGAAIGSAVGFLAGGFTGMWGARKAAKAVVGDSYTENKAKQQVQNAEQPAQTEEVATNPQQTTTEPTKEKEIDLTKIEDETSEEVAAKVDALITKYFNGTATEQEKAIFEAREQAAIAKVNKEMGPSMFNPMMSPMMNPFAFGPYC